MCVLCVLALMYFCKNAVSVEMLFIIRQQHTELTEAGCMHLLGVCKINHIIR